MIGAGCHSTGVAFDSWAPISITRRLGGQGGVHDTFLAEALKIKFTASHSGTSLSESIDGTMIFHPSKEPSFMHRFRCCCEAPSSVYFIIRDHALTNALQTVNLDYTSGNRGFECLVNALQVQKEKKNQNQMVVSLLTGLKTSPDPLTPNDSNTAHYYQ